MAPATIIALFLAWDIARITTSGMLAGDPVSLLAPSRKSRDSRPGSPSVQLGSSLNPATYGQSVTLTATVGSTETERAYRNGYVQKRRHESEHSKLDCGSSHPDKNKFGGRDTVNYCLYNGDAVSATSTSSTLSQVVNQATTTTTVVSSVNPSKLGR
jgi:hypothetical protein